MPRCGNTMRHFRLPPRLRWNCSLLGYYTVSSSKNDNYLVCNNPEESSSQYRGIFKCLGTTLTDQNGIHTETRAVWTRGMQAAVRSRIFLPIEVWDERFRGPQIHISYRICLFENRDVYEIITKTWIKIFRFCITEIVPKIKSTYTYELFSKTYDMS